MGLFLQIKPFHHLVPYCMYVDFVDFKSENLNKIMKLSPSKVSSYMVAKHVGYLYCIFMYLARVHNT